MTVSWSRAHLRCCWGGQRSDGGANSFVIRCWTVGVSVDAGLSLCLRGLPRFGKRMTIFLLFLSGWKCNFEDDPMNGG